MGFYYATYLYKGKLITDSKRITNSNDYKSFYVNNASIKYIPNNFFLLATIDPIIEKSDKSRGYIDFNELKNVVRNKQDVLDVLQEPNDWFVCEITTSTYEDGSYVTCNLPVLLTTPNSQTETSIHEMTVEDALET